MISEFGHSAPASQVKKMARCEASPRARGVHAACTRRACCVHAASILPRFHCVKPLRVYCECLPSQCELTANEFCSAARVPRVFIMPVRACCDHNSSHCVRTATVFILPRAPCDHISSYCVHTATVFYSTASPLRAHFKPLRAHCDCFLFYCEPPAITFQATACTLRLFFIPPRAPCDHIFKINKMMNSLV